MRSVKAFAVVAFAAQMTTSALGAQDTLRVLRHAPSDTASPATVVTVTFDRPVAGALDQTVSAERLFRIEPAVAGAVVWRDPVTIRFTPAQLLTPGSRFTVTIDTAFRAMDGARLAQPYRFTFRIPGPRMLARSFDQYNNWGDTLSPDGAALVLYSAAVDLERLARRARIELDGCAGAPPAIGLRPTVQRVVRASDPQAFQSFRFYARDTMSARLYSVVELEPVSPLPLDCPAKIVLPTMADDSTFGREERFAVQTAPAFRIRTVNCGRGLVCGSDRIAVTFASHVRRADVLRYVRLDSQAVKLIAQPDLAKTWFVAARVEPRSTHAIDVDAALRDIHDRPIEGPRHFTVTTADYLPAVIFARGTITVPRSGPRTFPVRAINARIARIISYRIPEELRVPLLSIAASSWSQRTLLRTLRPETTTVVLGGPLNTDTITQVPLPDAALAPDHPMVAVRVEVRDPLPGAQGEELARERGALAMAWPERPSDFFHAVLQATDLAVTAKLVGAADGSALVSDLASGRPLRGVTVTQVDPQGVAIARGVSRADGLATLTRVAQSTPQPRTPVSLTPKYPVVSVLEATSGDDRVSIAFADRDYGSPNPIDARSSGLYFDPSPLVSGAIFADRDIFRPGEIVHFKGIIRRGALGALTVPVSPDSARLTVRRRALSWGDNDTSAVRDTVLRLSRFGSIVDSVALRLGLPLGVYVADLKAVVGREWRTIQSIPIRLAEYRAPEFSIDVTRDSTPRYPGDTIRIPVTARYLLGAPMGGVVVTWKATTRAAYSGELRLPGAEGWTIGGWDSWDGPVVDSMVRVLTGVDTLDASGRAVVRVPATLIPARRAGHVDVSVAVYDVNRQAVTGSASGVVSPNARHILARTTEKNGPWILGGTVSVDVRVVGAHGEPVDDAEVRALVRRRRWLAPDPNIGVTGGMKIDTVHVDTIRTNREPVSFSFVTHGDGEYAIELSADNGHGETTRTRLSGWVSPRAIVSSRANAAYTLALTADTTRLSVGDTARVRFDSPFADAEAWVTIEREGVMEHRRLRVGRGKSLVALRVTERHVPNVSVAVVLVPRSDPMTPPDSATDRLRVGYVQLSVNNDVKRLAVSVTTDRAVYAPRDTAVVRLRVRDAGGRGVRSEVALWAVDEGVLALTRFTTPNLTARLYGFRGVGGQLWSTIPTVLTTDPTLEVAFVRNWGQLQAALASSVAMRVMDAPGETMAPDAMLRSRFRSTAFYLGAVETNARGDAVARGPLPDNLTTFRVMAVAVSADDRYGHADTTLVVTRPLAARASLPRFVRPGDSLFAGAAINARDGLSRRVEVEASADGLTIAGPARMSVSLSAGAASEARFVFRSPARDSARDTVAVRFSAGDGTNADAVEARLPVRPDFNPRTHARLGAVRDSAEIVMSLPLETDPRSSRLRLRIGTSPLSTMLAAYRWLRAYRYDCTEQIASTGRAMAAVWRATRKTQPNALGGDPRPKLQEFADAIATRQLPDGSIRYWLDHPWTSAWLTVHAGLFLLDARDAGVSVDTTVLRRVNGYLGSFVATPVDTGGMNRFEQQRNRLMLGARVAAVEYLRRAGVPDTAKESALLRIAGRMTWEDRLRLAEVIAPRPDTRGAAEAILDAAFRATTVAGHRVDLPDSATGVREFPSRVAPAARLLSATLALRPTHALLGGLIETVLQHGRAERGLAWNTQDYSSVVLALAAFADSGAVDRTVRARLGGTTFTARRPAVGIDSSISVPLSGLLETGSDGHPQVRLRLDAGAGDRTIYYALEVDEVPLHAPVTPDIQGIVVERWYERFADGAPITEVKAGELVRVRLRVTVPADRQFVTVEDPLPAGLEPIDRQLLTSRSIAAFSPASDAAGAVNRDALTWQAWLYGSWDDGWWSPWEHKEMHDDRVVYSARMLWTGSYTATYLARATTAGSFVLPPAHAEEMYNSGVQGRSGGGRFLVASQP